MIAQISKLGRSTSGVTEQLGRVAAFAAHILRVTLHPPLRLREFFDEMFKIGVLSILIICVSGVAVGMVLSLQGYTTLVRFGAENAAFFQLMFRRRLDHPDTAYIERGLDVFKLVLAEVAADGLRMMAIDPVDYVVRPKAWAMAVSMPLLTGLFIVSAIAGGYFVGVQLMGIDGGTYMSSMENSVDFEHDVAGSLLKAGVFGVLVALISTYRGHTAEPTSSGVSSATTSTVVIGSVSVLIFDYILTALWGV